MQVICFKVLLKFKMAAMYKLQFFCMRKTLKLSRKLFNFYNHINHDIEMCR